MTSRNSPKNKRITEFQMHLLNLVAEGKDPRLEITVSKLAQLQSLLYRGLITYSLSGYSLTDKGKLLMEGGK